MADAKHTPGPWHVEPQQDGASWEICTEKRGAWIMLLRSTAAATEEERAEDLANAVLMSTAPELLKELRDLIELADTAMHAANRDGSEYDADAELAPARAAITKAIGGAS